MNSTITETKLLPSVKCISSIKQPKIDPLSLTIFDSLLWTGTFAAWTLGSVLMFGIIHYERFGGDPQKRSLQNRLASQIIVACILFMNSSNFVEVNLLYRFASSEVLLLHAKIHRAIHFILLDLITLHTLVVYLQVVVWKRLREFNEELIIRALWKSLYFGNLALSMLCPLGEKMDLYLFIIGGNRQPAQSHVAETPQAVTRWVRIFPNYYANR